MPASSFRCDVNNQPVPFKACQNCASTGLAKSLGCGHFSGVLKALEQNIRKPMDGLSVTELIGCPRALYFKQRVDYSVYPSSLYWAFRGTMIHKVLEDQKEDGDIQEQRFFIEIGDIKLSGQPDLIRGDVIYDFKTTARIPEAPYDHHIVQISLYAYLLSRQHPAIEVKTGKIVYLSFMKHVTLDCELWPLTTCESYITQKLSEYKASQDAPPPFEKYFSTKNWQCGKDRESSYCDVRDECTQNQNIPTTPMRRKVA